MPLDYSLDATSEHNIHPYFPYVSNIRAAEFDEMRFKSTLPDAGNPLPPDPMEDLAYVPVSSARLSSHKPRVVSDSAVLLGLPQDKTTSSDSSHGLRYQRTLSVGCQPYSNSQDLTIGPDNSTEITTEIPLEINEQLADRLGMFQDSPGTSSGLGYDGTQPIAYIQVHNPQRYSLRTMDSVYALRNADSFQGRPKGEARPMVNSIHSQTGDQAIHTQQPAPRDRAANQPSTYGSTLDLYSDLHTQTTFPLNSGYLYPSTDPMVRNKVINHGLNNSQYTSLHCRTSTLSIPKTQSSRPDPPDRDRAGNNSFSTNEFNSHSNNSLVHSTMPAQAMDPPVLTEGPDLVGPDHALKIPRNNLQGQVITENLVFSDILLPKLDSVYACNSDSSFHQGPFDYQSSVPYDHSPYGAHTWSQMSPSPVVRNEFQSTPVLVVPAPRRSLNYGAFLTPDPPCQISNIDLPPRPGTSPPRQMSAPNGRLRLLPNIGRRRSEQTWRIYGLQSDSVRLPELPPPPEDIGQFGVNDYAPSSLAVPVETHALGPPTDNVPTHQFLIQQLVASSTQERPSVPKPGPSQDHEIAKSTVRQNRVSEERRQSNPKQMHRRAILPLATSTQSGNSQERTNQKSRPPNVEPPTQVVPSAIEKHSAWRATTTKRRYSHGNPENTDAAKKRKVVGEISEVISTEPETTPVPHNRSQEQNASKLGQDCVYFDVNTWRGDNLANQDVPQRLPVSSFQTQLQSGDGMSTERSLGKSTEGSSSDGQVPPGGSENWLPVDQGDGSGIQYMNWGSSVNLLLDQTLEVSGALDPATEQYLTTLIQLGHPVPEASVPVLLLEPYNFESERLLADYDNMGTFSAVA